MSLVLDGTSGSTGTGAFALANSPSLVTPNLGTPSSVNLTNATNVPVNQATGTLAVANGGTGVTTKTGTGNVVLSTSPVLTTPSITSGSLTMSDSTTITSGKQAAKAWVRFTASATPTINDSYNVSSITYNGTGDFTVNFTNSMPNANYVATISCGEAGSSSRTCSPYSFTTSGFRFLSYSGGNVQLNMPLNSVIFFSS